LAPFSTHPEAGGKCFRRFFNAVQTRSRTPLSCVRATEFQDRGVVHYHIVLRGAETLSGWQLQHLWKKVGGGISRFALWKSKSGGSQYITKHAAQDNDLEIFGEPVLQVTPAATLAPPAGSSPARPGDKESDLSCEAISKRGRRVILSQVCGTHADAKSHYAVHYFQTDRRTPQRSRFPVFRERAEWYFNEFIHDRISPSGLGIRLRQAFPPRREA
jgi:hypothetical protein